MKLDEIATYFLDSSEARHASTSNPSETTVRRLLELRKGYLKKNELQNKT